MSEKGFKIIFNHLPLKPIIIYDSELRFVPPFKFEEKIIRGNRVRGEGINILNEFAMKKLEEVSDVEVEVRVRINIKTKVKNIIRMLSSPSVEFIEFVKPLEIPVDDNEVKELIVKLLNTETEIKTSIAERLFNKEFAEVVRQHNKQIHQHK